MRGWTLHDWRTAYRNGARPEDLLTTLVDRLSKDDPSWISIIDPDTLARQLARLAVRLAESGFDALPLFGVPFAAKDNIDVAGFTTTAGCPAFAYQPSRNAAVIECLIQAGAIPVGKTNLDQFATGLVGVRTPYGIPVNTFNAEYVSGGSSSGSSTVVARGLVPFALGTDTAGSGRIPAGLNNIVGWKPTRGALSGRGVVPACRTLDCISILSTTVGDAASVYDVVAQFDPEDGLSRRAPYPVLGERLAGQPRFGIPAHPEFFGDTLAEQAFSAALSSLAAQGATLVPLDFSVLDQVSQLLYDGPWVAERYAAIREFAATHENDIDPVVREVIFKAEQYGAADTFEAMYRLADLKRAADALLSEVDALVVPTAPTHYKITELKADPIRLNSRLGQYTNYVNLLDWSAIAVPASIRPDGLPFGITLIADAWKEGALAHYAAAWHANTGLPRGATGRPISAGDEAASLARFEQDLPVNGALNGNSASASTPAHASTRATEPVLTEPQIRVAVVGAHLRGMPLNHELTSRAARFVEETTTNTHYSLFALAGTTPPKPGLVRNTVTNVSDARASAAIIVELWDVPATAFGGFVAGIPAPLGIGTLTLVDGRQVKGFICEPAALADATDITAFGGWRAYLASRTTSTKA
jgi:allophanate hydrolase